MVQKANDEKKIETKLDQIKELLERLVAINMYANGVAKDEIAKNLKIRNATITGYLKGMKVEKQK